MPRHLPKMGGKVTGTGVIKIFRGCQYGQLSYYTWAFYDSFFTTGVMYFPITAQQFDGMHPNIVNAYSVGEYKILQIRLTKINLITRQYADPDILCNCSFQCQLINLLRLRR